MPTDDESRCIHLTAYEAATLKSWARLANEAHAGLYDPTGLPRVRDNPPTHRPRSRAVDRACDEVQRQLDAIGDGRASGEGAENHQETT